MWVSPAAGFHKRSGREAMMVDKIRARWHIVTGDGGAQAEPVSLPIDGERRRSDRTGRVTC